MACMWIMYKDDQSPASTITFTYRYTEISISPPSFSMRYRVWLHLAYPLKMNPNDLAIANEVCHAFVLSCIISTLGHLGTAHSACGRHGLV